MRKIIGILSVIIAVSCFSATAQCCSSSNKKTTETKSCCDNTKTTEAKSCCNKSKFSEEKLSCTKTEGEVKAYYFHATRRCATCQAVEAVSKEAIKEYYGDKVTFISINREDKKNEALLKKYKVNWQTLIITQGDQTINLTNFAFMNARTNPDKLKKKVKSTIDSLM